MQRTPPLRCFLVVALFFQIAACSTVQIHSNTQQHSLGLTRTQLNQGGLILFTPSAITGQEEDRQIMAQVFAARLSTQRPDIRHLSLPETLSLINDSGLADAYKIVLTDYRVTGILQKRLLQQMHQLAKKRYIMLLTLSDFGQDTKSRFGAFGLRLIETRQAYIRLFVQIWDAHDGTIVWEATEELNYSRETLAEKPVTFNSMVEVAAENLIRQLP